MALRFVTFVFLAVVVSGFDDHVSLLQTSMVVETKKVQRDSSSSFGEALRTCPSMSEIDMDGVSCTSAKNGVHIKSVQTHTTAETVEKASLDAIEDQSTRSKAETGSTDGLRCVLNLITFLFVMDILRRLLSNKGSDNVDEAAADADVHAMLRAAEQNDVAAVKAILDQGMSLYAGDDSGRTVLHTAAKAGAAAVVGLLLERGAKVDVVDSWDETPLHYAARAGAIDICKSLLARGAKIDALNGQDWTPLVAAASIGQKDTCEWLMAHGATQDDLAESSLPSLLQQLLKVDESETCEPELPMMPNLEAKLEADLLRRALEPKPEWQEAESLAQWVAAIDDYDA